MISYLLWQDDNTRTEAGSWLRISQTSWQQPQPLMVRLRRSVASLVHVWCSLRLLPSWIKSYDSLRSTKTSNSLFSKEHYIVLSVCFWIKKWKYLIFHGVFFWFSKFPGDIHCYASLQCIKLMIQLKLICRAVYQDYCSNLDASSSSAESSEVDSDAVNGDEPGADYL